MSRSLHPHPRRSIGLAATFLAMLPGAALAADAPLRYVGIDPGGNRVWNIHWVAASEDAHELIGTQIGDPVYDAGQSTVVDRDVVAGTTTAVTPPGFALVAASTDLRKLLVRTKVSESPNDTNTDEDFYVLDRDTGTFTLVSVDASGKAIGNNGGDYHPDGTSFWTILSPGMSGDGSTVQFYKYAGRISSDGQFSSDPGETDRINVATGAISKLPAPTDGSSYWTAMDDAGHVAVSGEGIYVDGVKKVAIPNGYREPAVSPDGSAVAEWGYNGHSVTVWNVATGASKDYAVPEYRGGRETPTVRYVANGGTTVYLNDIIDSSDGERLAFGKIDGNGSFSQLGSDVKISDWEYLTDWTNQYRGGAMGVITRNGQFAVTGLSLAQLGTTPLPGSEPTTPSPAQVSDYLFIGDTTCHYGGFWNLFRIYTDPTVTLAVKPQRADLRRPVSFTGTVSKTDTGKQIASGTITPGKPVSIPGLGINGAYKFDGTVKFSDGTTLTGTSAIASHASPYCYAFYG